MKNKISKILFTCICLLLLIPTIIFAAWTGGGGTGDQSGNSGGASGGNSQCEDGYWQAGFEDDDGVEGISSTAAYRFDLVYKEKNGGREILKTVIAQNTSRAYNDMIQKGPAGRESAINTVREYVDAVNSTNTAKYGAKYVESGPLVDLVNRFLDGETVDSIFGPGGLDDNNDRNTELIKSYIIGSEGFAMDEDDLQEKQDDVENLGSLDSFGYRIMIQKLQTFQNGCNGDPNMWKAMTRKDAASNNEIKQALVGSRRTVMISPNESKAANDIFTTRDDIGVHEATWERDFFRNATKGIQVRELTDEFADPNNGSGYNILWFSTDPFKDYDYTVESLCTNCDSDNADNVAYIIKDTSDWDGILNSYDSDNENVQGYYKKSEVSGGEEGDGVYCRQEYTVYFPNAKDQIYVDPGKYFTINPSPDSWKNFADTVGFSSTIPLLKPVKVYKKQECQANVTLEQGENESDEAFAARVHQAKIDALNKYMNSNERTFRNSMGTVYFRYNETYKKSQYNMDDTDEFEEYGQSRQEYKANVDDAAEMLTMEATSSYELPDEYYQYIRLKDGLSVKTKPNEADTKYKNVGIENLPISFENHGTPITLNGKTVYKAADIQFAYDLPTSGTNISEAANSDDYLATENSGENIYQKYLNGDYDEEEKKQLENGVCAQMYGFGTAEFNTCAKERAKDKSPSNNNGSGGGNCISRSSILGSTTSGYSCKVLTNYDNEDSDCTTEEDANRLGVDWNPLLQACCPPGTTFNPELGKCSDGPGDGPGDDTCRIENGKYYDFDGNEITKEEYDRICPGDGPDDGPGSNTCRIEDGKYYDFNGNEITQEEYYEICPTDVPSVCPKYECPYGCCPSGECAPMPDGTCPGQGGIDVIYRTIDLETPFPGQDAENRVTGANWCSYNIITQKIDCKWNNATSNNYIIRERSGHEYGNDVYDNNHILYQITLDTKLIKEIRDYNDDHKYDDDWVKSCYQNGKACFSKFLRDGNIYSKLSGKCKLISGSNFYDCDEPV